MFHEIITHTRKIKDKLEDQKHSSAHRWKEIITELLIIVFAVSLTTLFHDLNEHRSQQKEVVEFLSDLKDDLNKDIKGIENQKIVINQLIGGFQFVRNLNKKQVDSLDKLNSNYQPLKDFRLFFGEENKGNYESFESSGKTVFIENKKLKKLILSYYNHQIPASQKTGETLMTGFDKVNDFVIKHIIVQKNKNAVFLDSDFQADLEINILHAKKNIKIGEESVKKLREIIGVVDEELKNSQ